MKKHVYPRCLLRQTYKFLPPPSIFSKKMLRVPGCLVDASYIKRHSHLPSSSINAPSLTHPTSDRARLRPEDFCNPPKSSSCGPGGRTTTRASPSTVPASPSPRASKSGRSESMPQPPRRWRGLGSMSTHRSLGTELLHFQPYLSIYQNPC